MGKNDYANLGEEIKNVVQDALNSKEFQELNRNIKITVNNALDEAKKSISDSQKKRAKRERVKKQEWQGKKFTEAVVLEDKTDTLPAPINRNPPGKISGVVMQVFGWIGMSFSAISGGVMYIVTASLGVPIFVFQLVMCGLLPLFALSTFLIVKGGQLRRRFKRFTAYVKELNGRAICSVKALGEKIGKQSSYVIKDISKMIHAGFFPEGRLSADNETLLLSSEAEKVYAIEQEERRLKQENRQKARLREEERLRREAAEPGYAEYYTIVAQGQKTIQEIREANNCIKSSIISEKLDRLERVLKKIFYFVEQNPDEMEETHKFMDYYLPTTLKLVNAYRDLDNEAIQGKNITSAKQEIEETLDTINHAFENLLDSFYENVAMDISTDISVLNTVFAQEGLTESEFEMKAEEK